MMKLITRFLIALLLLGNFAYSLTEDKAGKHDWLQPYIGKAFSAIRPTQTSSTTSSTPPPGHLFLATQSNVLACIDIATGTLLWRKIFSQDDKIVKIRLVGYGVVVLSNNGNTLRIFDTVGRLQGETLFDINNAPSSSIADFAIQYDSQGRPKAVVTKSHQGTLTAFSTAGQLLPNHEVPTSLFTIQEEEEEEGDIYSLLTQVQQDNSLSTTRTTTGGYITIEKVLLSYTLDTDSTTTTTRYSLVVYTNGDLAMISTPTINSPHHNLILWSRHDSLSSPLDIIIADLPPSTPDLESTWTSTQPGIKARLTAEFLPLLSNFRPLTAEEQQFLAIHHAKTNHNNRPTRDADGFRRQVLVMGSSGTLGSLHTGDGRVLWTLHFSSGNNKGVERKMVKWTVPHDPREISLVAVLEISSSSRKVTAHVIDPTTGNIVHSSSINTSGAGIEVVPLPRPVHVGGASAADQYMYAIVEKPSDGGDVPKVAGVFPVDVNTDMAVQALHNAQQEVYYWTVLNSSSNRTSRVVGYAMSASSSSTGLDITLTQRWSMELLSSTSTTSTKRVQVLATATSDASEAVYSAAKPLGNGDILLRYLNPNIAVIITGQGRHTDGNSTPSSSSSSSPELTITLLDTVTGRVLHSEKHIGGTGPAHAVVTESLTAVHFWSVSEHRWIVAAIELYNVAPHGLGVGSLAVKETNTTISSWDAPQLEIESKTFFTKLPAAALGITKTGRGISAKKILLGTTSGQIYMMDRRHIDPRRPVVPPGTKPNAAAAGEGLPPYHPELPVIPTAFATLNKRLAGLTGLRTEAAMLESSTLLIGWGMDVFFARLAPSQTYDMVPEDFPFALLVISVVGLAAALIAVRMAVKKRATRMKWE